MSNAPSKFYSVMVVGDNPTELMAKYDKSKEVEPYIKYRYLDAEKLHKNSIKIYEDLINNVNILALSEDQISALKEKLKSIKNMTRFEFYQMLTEGCSYDENGDAWSTVNPNGKWDAYQTGNHFSVPLITKNGVETSSALNKEVNWKILHMAEAAYYELVWDLAHEIVEPTNDSERQIRDNMINRKKYFSNFKSKEDYVIHSAAYWNYAYLDENGWVSIDDENVDEKTWIKNFYPRFVEKLNPNDKITIFDYTINSF